MENPEEVLQALDEFQKMRPTEIPRELEDYLCFVAKTGDPVYQWSLIKPLFREKLVRVMSDFYESCPTLDLATSPNLEQFNYDSMKGNLLELLESFANAPFTVQRICELLTTPRKEYNRVDKFMRAIEKNILVVSTREPGATARRGENGDSMINGSIDDDSTTTTSTATTITTTTTTNQQSHQVEMDSWVRDCTNDPNVSLQTTGHDVPLVDALLPSKLTTDNQDCLSTVIHDKSEPSTKSELNNFITSTLSSTTTTSTTTTTATATTATTATATTTTTTTTSTTTTTIITNDVLSVTPNPIISTNDPILSPTSIQNSESNVGQVSGISSDVPEAIMNEDTSSQPSLDSENDDNDSINSKKLQTTFQSQDFVQDTASNKFCQDEKKSNDKNTFLNELDVNDEKNFDDDSNKIKNENKLNYNEHDHLDLPVDEPIAEKRSRLNDGTVCVIESTHRSESPSPCQTHVDKLDVKFQDPQDITELETQASINENSTKSTFDQEIPDFESIEKNCPGEMSKEIESSQQETQEISTSETPRPIIQEPPCQESQETPIDNPRSKDIIIQEAMDDDAKIINTTISDPIPIVQEPQDDNLLTNTQDTSIVELVHVPSPTDNSNVTGINEPEIPVDTSFVTEINKQVVSDDTNFDIINKNEPAEPMEIDSQESMPVFSEDEPMEEESGDQLKS